MEGWISFHRKIWENPISSKPNYLAVWLYVISKANHKEKTIILNGKKITIKRGSFLGSLSKISEHFNLSRSTVKQIIDYFESDKMLNTERTRNYTIFHILNYDQYQSVEHQSNTNRTPTATTNNDNNENNETTNTKKEKNIKKENSPTLENLEVDHVKDWLNEQRAQGKFLTVDEFEQLEHFKNYCIANGRDKGKRKYANFVRAFQNSFSWDNVKKKGQTNGTTSQHLTPAQQSEQWLEAEYRRIEADQEAQSPANQLSYQPEF